MRNALLAGLLVGGVMATAIGTRAQESGTARPVTFTEHIAPIIFDNCTSCHRPGEMAPFSLLSYADVRPRGRRIAAVTQSRQMPPWKAEHADFAFRGDRRLSGDQ